MAVAVGRARWGSLTKSRPRVKVQVSQPFSPAHDLVGEQHAAHLRVFVLPLIDDGLGRGKGTGSSGCGLLLGPSAAGRWAPPPGNTIPSKPLCGGLGVRAGTGSPAPQTGITTRTDSSGTNSIDSVCPQAALSRSSSAWDQGPRSGGDEGGDTLIPTLPMALGDLCFCSHCPLGSPSWFIRLPLCHPYHLPAQARVSPLEGVWVSFLTHTPPPTSTLCPEARSKLPKLQI